MSAANNVCRLFLRFGQIDIRGFKQPIDNRALRPLADKTSRQFEFGSFIHTICTCRKKTTENRQSGQEVAKKIIFRFGAIRLKVKNKQ